MKRVLAIILSLMLLLTSFTGFAVEQGEKVEVTFAFTSTGASSISINYDYPAELKLLTSECKISAAGMAVFGEKKLSVATMGTPITNAAITLVFEVAADAKDGIYNVTMSVKKATDDSYNKVDASILNPTEKVIVGDVTAHEHTPAEAVKENIVPATCKQGGTYDEVVYCSECEEEISRTAKTTEKAAHTPAEPVKENEVAATCGAAGSYDEVIKCSVCGEEISREAKTTEKLAHTPAEAVKENEVAATCGAAGSYDEVVYCSVCKAEISREAKTVEATGEHTEAPIGEAKAATCTEAGLTNGSFCSVCNTELVAQEVIPALGHDYVIIPAVEAECHKDGLTVGVGCSVCEEILIKQDVVPAAHPEDMEMIKEPTCTEKGKKFCDMCGDTLEEYEALGHILKTVEAKEPTYTEEGNTAGEYCEQCDYTTVKVLDKLPRTDKPVYNVVKISDTHGKIEWDGNEAAKPLANPYVNITWRYKLANGDTMSFKMTFDVNEDGTFKLYGPEMPAGSKLMFINVEVVDIDNADTKDRGDYTIYGSATL